MTEVPTFVPDSAAVPEYVRKGERLLWRGRPTLAVLVRQTFGLIVGFLFFSLFSLGAASDAGAPVLAILPLFVVIAAILVGLNVMRLRRTQYILTDQGVYTRTGLIGQTVIQTTFEKITDISVKQDVIGRIFGYSSLLVNTAGSNTAPVQMEGVRDAFALKQLIEAARERAIGTGPREAPPPRRLPRFVPDKALMTLVCPNTRRSYRRPKAELGTSVPCPHCASRHKAEVRKAGRARAS
ncbi:MAG: PH domain-containing protein [Euryarchaeota archaeon]|nr:PH domain-containing protein [Euryarchaeota archaeon]